MRRLWAFAAAALLLAAGCAQYQAGYPASETAGRQIGAGEDWDNPGGDWAKSHFSRLTDITPANAGQLGLAWEYDLGSARVQEATPVVIDGVMYTSGNLGRVYALDAASGRELWTFTPEVDMQVNRFACCDQANRGVAVHQGRVYIGALDGWLYALDAATGAVAWKVDTITDRTRGYTITGAPEIAGDLVIIGNAGAEYDVRGYVTAYNAATGQEAWRFWTIPRDPAEGPQESEALEKALATWDPQSRWDIGGGGTVWDAITYDPVFDQVIIGTGNGGPYPLATRSPSGGDNLYLNSLVAIDRKTGAMKWHFQETPQDSWDLTATQPMVLTELEIEGESRPVILHTPKNGFFFVVDRQTGKPLAVNPLVRTSWASGWNLETGKPNLTPEYSDYSTGPKIVFPASSGARNWHPAAYDPTRNLYFASVVDMGNLMFIPPGQENPPHRERALNAASALIFTADLEAALAALPPPMQEAVKALPQWRQVQEQPFSSQLRAIDPMTGATKWAADLDGWQDRGGVMATQSGLVVHGTVSGKLIVRDAENGRVLKSIDTGSSMLAAPMTYKVGGVQYIAVQTGWGGGGWGFVPPYAAAYNKGNANRLLVFRLGGAAVPIPADLPPLEPAPEAPDQLPGVTPETIALGSALFTENCSICHSNQPRAPLPDLRRMRRGTHAIFDRIVLDGALLPTGMPRFDDLLTQEQVQAIHAWLIEEQRTVRERELQLQAEGKPLDTRSLTIMSNF
jgi:quinohemoprotein ethanol dehydrogenase